MNTKTPSSEAKIALNKKFEKIIIWGLRSYTPDSFRYIFRSFYRNLQKLEIPAIWCDDQAHNNSYITKKTLVLAVGHASKHLNYKRGTYYCLHNFDSSNLEKFESAINTIKLQVYTGDCERHLTHRINHFAGFDQKNKVLYQPWGTDLLPEEFAEPVYPTYSPFVFWVGSIWDNALGQGNIAIINQLRTVLKQHNLRFINLKYMPDSINQLLIRNSRLAPAVAGKWQVNHDYLPCRMFKNISYGQLGLTNIQKFSVIIDDKLVSNKLEDIISYALSLNKNKYKESVKEQQSVIRDYTYANSLINIAHAF